MKTINLEYFALLKEERGRAKETVSTSASTVFDLYRDLKGKYRFKLDTDLLRVAVNNEFVTWETPLKDNDTVIFIPPVAGG